MPTRFFLAGLQFFAVSAAIALAVVVLAPPGAMRFFGLLALGSAAGGFALDLFALRDADPHAFMVLRYRVDHVLQRARATVVRAYHAVTRTVAAKAPDPVR